MDREILFRGKRVDNGKWVYGSLTKHRLKGYAFIEVLTDKGHSLHTVIPETVGQYTGLTDKNGKKIFEGDIVDILTENEEIGTVVFDEGAFIVSADGFCLDFQSNIDSTSLEVIGNIYDNPELLKERDNNV